jgi:hypothetical protein
MIGAWSDALAGSLGLMMAASGPDITEAALQRDDADWWRLCREADQQARQQPPNARLKRLRKLLDSNTAIDRAWAELHGVAVLSTKEAPAATVEALMFSLRAGIVALKHPSTLRRLARLSESQARDVAERVRKFKPNIAPAWELDAVEALLEIWSVRHGR